jgi:hypothetical protein
MCRSSAIHWGCPLCPLGEPLIWEDYDPSDQGVLIYRGDPRHCPRCPLAGMCPRQFEFSAGAHETLWGMLPYHTRLSSELRRMFRPRIEQGFSTIKRRL